MITGFCCKDIQEVLYQYCMPATCLIEQISKAVNSLNDWLLIEYWYTNHTHWLDNRTNHADHQTSVGQCIIYRGLSLATHILPTELGVSWGTLCLGFNLR
jgi:hypothetical protein